MKHAPLEHEAVVLAESMGVQTRMMQIGHQRVRVGIRPGTAPTPLLIFNGIGASLELLRPVMPALGDVETIIFDIPGTGDSPPSMLPYRLSCMASLASKLLKELGYVEPVDVLGVSWGGALAQQFAFQHKEQCRRLVLAATTFGLGMVPGQISALSKMMDPSRYEDPEFMVRYAGDLYGGALRKNPERIREFEIGVKAPSARGYFYQLLAIYGWSSLHFLARLPQPTLIMAGYDDPIIRPFNAKVMAELIPNSKLQMVDDGHMFLLTDTERHAKTIHAFLN